MKESTSLKKQAKAHSKSPEESLEEDADKTRDKAVGKAKAKARAKGKKKAQAVVEIFSEKMGEGEQVRDKLWMDDLFCAIEHGFTIVQKLQQQSLAKDETKKMGVIANCCEVAFTFCFIGEYLHNGKLMTKWSELRTEIIAMVRRSYETLQLPAMSGGSPTALAPEQVTQELLQAVSKPSDEDDVIELAKDPNCDQIKTFLRSNSLDLPVKVHPAFGQMLAGVLTNKKASANLEEVMELIHVPLFRILRPEWISTALRMNSVLVGCLVPK